MVDNWFVVVSLLSFSPSFLECGGGDGGMGPMNKWYFELFFPFGLMVAFSIWYCCLSEKSIAQSTVKEASIQVGFVWLFETIVSSSLKALDCTGGTTGPEAQPETRPDVAARGTARGTARCSSQRHSQRHDQM